ncbi:MAG TPA: DUF4276 family protein [Thermoanaerobaculia bacterium]
MARLLISVEGQTEETFVREVLRPYLQNVGFSAVDARLMGNVRQRSGRGGVRKWASIKAELLRHLAQDRSAVLGMMVDFHGMPKSGDGGWPGRAAASALPAQERGAAVERAIAQEIASAMGTSFDQSRFVPCVVVHEFEGLLFSDCGAFAQSIGRPDLESRFQEIREQFGTPEEINDSPNACPSSRVRALVSNYEKPLLGTLAALEIGLATIARECQHFGRWVTRLERIGERRTEHGP